MKNWDGDQLIAAPTPGEAAERLAEFLHVAGCDTVNVRIHVKDLTPAQVDEQLAQHGGEFLDTLRGVLAG